MPKTADLEFLDDHQRSLVEENLSLVNRIGSRWRARCRTHVEYADLLQVGALGLIDAARRHDPARHETFQAFAKERIKGAICDALRAIDPLTRRRRQAVRAMELATRELETYLGREPDADELSRKLGWSAAEVAETQADMAALSVGWAQTLELPDEGGDDEAFLATNGNHDPCSSLMRDELKAELARAISDLPERQQVVLSLYYNEGLTMKEIGDVLAVTESRVSQIHSAAVAALRAAVREREHAGVGA
jgi:RNA polymerase sigma factor for flagellar operon FliA